MKYSCLKVYDIGGKVKPRDSPEVKSRHLSPAMSLLSPDLGGTGIQMTGAFHTALVCRRPPISCTLSQTAMYQPNSYRFKLFGQFYVSLEGSVTPTKQNKNHMINIKITQLEVTYKISVISSTLISMQPVLNWSEVLGHEVYRSAC